MFGENVVKRLSAKQQMTSRLQARRVSHHAPKQRASMAKTLTDRAIALRKWAFEGQES